MRVRLQDDALIAHRGRVREMPVHSLKAEMAKRSRPAG
jgi:hypothetical protein